MQNYNPAGSANKRAEDKFLLALRAHYRLFALTALAVFMVGAIVTFLLPKKYESYMKLLVKSDRPELVLTADNNLNSLQTNEVSETQINSEIQLLNSVDILKQVVAKAGLDRRIPGDSETEKKTSLLAQERALQKLQKDLVIAPIRKSNVIQLIYKASTPQLAVSVLQELADAFLVHRLHVHSAQGTHGSLDKQTETLEHQLSAAEQNLTEIRQRYSGFALPEEREAFMEHALDAQAAYEQSEAQVAELQKKVEQERRAIKAIPARVVTQTRSIPNPTLVERLTTMLAELRNRRTDLLTNSNPDNRLARNLDQQIAQTEAAVNRASSQALHEEATDVNPVRQTAETELVTAESQLAGFQNRRTTLRQIAEFYRRKMFDFAGATVELDAMRRKVGEHERKYLLYARKSEESMIADSLDTQRIANVSIAETPTTPVEPSSPRVGLDLLLSGILALFCGSTAVLAADFKTTGMPLATSETPSGIFSAQASAANN